MYKKGNNVREIPSSAWKPCHPQISQGEGLHKSSVNVAYFHVSPPAFETWFYFIRQWNCVRCILFCLVYCSHQFCSQIINYFFRSCFSEHKVLLQLAKFSKPQLPNYSVDFSSDLDEYNNFRLKTCSSIVCYNRSGLLWKFAIRQHRLFITQSKLLCFIWLQCDKQNLNSIFTSFRSIIMKIYPNRTNLI